MQDITSKLNLRGGSVNNGNNIPLPCTLSEVSCQSTSTEPNAYNCNKQDNCSFAGRNKITACQKKNKALYFKSTISLSHYVKVIM